jgi:hypothetical protein
MDVINPGIAPAARARGSAARTGHRPARDYTTIPPPGMPGHGLQLQLTRGPYPLAEGLDQYHRHLGVVS